MLPQFPESRIQYNHCPWLLGKKVKPYLLKTWLLHFITSIKWFPIFNKNGSSFQKKFYGCKDGTKLSMPLYIIPVHVYLMDNASFFSLTSLLNLNKFLFFWRKDFCFGFIILFFIWIFFLGGGEGVFEGFFFLRGGGGIKLVKSWYKMWAQNWQQSDTWFDNLTADCWDNWQQPDSNLSMQPLHHF